ncbi:FMRFamide receptor [Trichinella zimbabwensis]|uniref:FMRFamide receptor n=1 Tax=Trichinella zimbabwensis TaxID=268475 RepID=A0A0V1H3H3_9BILA|nr:FMRFamide receptor [Trichinella zimbabwensis]
MQKKKKERHPIMDRSAPAILTTDDKIDCQARQYLTQLTRRTSNFSNYHLQKSPAIEGDMKQFDCNKKDIFSKICFTSVFYLLISVQHFSIHTVVTGDICLLTCLQKFVEKMNPESSNSLPSSSSEYAAVNVTNNQSTKGSENLQPNLRYVCRVFTSFKSCTNSCSSPVALNVLQNGFVGFNFICIERQEEFFEYAPCLEEKEALISRMCKNELRLSELAFHSLQHMMNSKSTHRETILLDFCRNTSLIVMCVLPATRAECGYGSADLMREFIALTFRNIYEFLETFPNVNTDDHNSCYLLMRLLTTFDLNEKVLPTKLEEQATPINVWSKQGNIHKAKIANSYRPINRRHRISSSTTAFAEMSKLLAVLSFALFIFLLYSFQWLACSRQVAIHCDSQSSLVCLNKAMQAFNESSECGEGWPSGPADYITQLVFGPILASFVFISVISNIVCIIVLHRSRQWPRLNTCLIALAAWEIVLMCASFFLYSFPVLLYHNSPVNGPYVKTYAYWYTAANMANQAAVWVVLVMAIDRYFAICHPLKHRRFGDTARGKILLLVSTFAIIHATPRFFEVSVVYCSPVDNSTPVVTVVPSGLQQNYIYRMLYKVIGGMLLYSVGPFLVLSFIAAQVSKHMSKYAITRRKLIQEESPGMQARLSVSSTSDKVRDQNRDQLLLIMIIKFLTCHSLPTALDVMETVVPAELFASVTISRLIDVSNILVMINAGCNVFIYIACSQNFRHQISLHLLRSRRFSQPFYQSSTRDIRRHGYDYTPRNSKQLVV